MERLRNVLKEPAQPDRTIRAAGELALAAQRAAEKLRRAGLGELLPEADGRPSVSVPAPRPSTAGPPTPRPSTSAHAGHAHGALEHAPEKVQHNPTLSAILEYSRLGSLALRHLATYVEHGPPNVRAQGIGELVRLSKEQPRWAGLESLAREALLTERDPELERKLDNLVKNLRAERGR